MQFYVYYLSSSTSGETVKGSYDITWHAADSNWGRDFVYNLFYTNDKTGTWTELGTKLMTTSYTWDTSTVKEGQYFLKLVAVDTVDGSSYEFIQENSFTVVHSDTSNNSTSNNPGLPGFEFGLIFGSFVCIIIVRRQRLKYHIKS